MPDALAEFLDDLNDHIETEIAKAPATVAEAWRREDTPLSTVELLRLLAQHDRAADLLGGEPIHAAVDGAGTDAEQHDDARALMAC
jgi:hypothetical protein